MQSHVRIEHACLVPRTFLQTDSLDRTFKVMEVVLEARHVEGVGNGGMAALVRRILCFGAVCIACAGALLVQSCAMLGEQCEGRCECCGCSTEKKKQMSYVKSCVESNHTYQRQLQLLFFFWPLRGFSLSTICILTCRPNNLRPVVEVVPVVAGADPVVVGGGVVGLVVGVRGGVVELAGLGVLAGSLGVEGGGGLTVESLEHLQAAIQIS